MKVVLLMALRDLLQQPVRAIAHAALFAIAIMAVVTLGNYRQSLRRDYARWGEDQLLVQESNSLGEFYGSRISPDILDLLRARGVSEAVPEIHNIVGTSVQDAVLLRGVDLGSYDQIVPFEIKEGRALQVGDGPRQAMIGVRLAQRLGAGVGDTIRLRGRDFKVIGTFATGTYTENKAWVPLEGAQELMGWGQDVSMYVIPDNGIIQAGEELAQGVSVVTRGDYWSAAEDDWQALFYLIELVARSIGVAAALSLAALLWKMAQQRRWDIGILRSIGYGKGIFLGYIGVQGFTVALVGGIVGVLAAIGTSAWAQVSLGGLALNPEMSLDPILVSSAWLMVLAFVSVIFPIWRLSQKSVIELMH